MDALSPADRALSELAGVAGNLPNPHLLIAPFMRREAVLSSRIEGTQSSLEDLINYEAAGSAPSPENEDVKEVANYVRALEYGLRRMHELPICLRLIREMHEELMLGVRGNTRAPGEFRRQQNWIAGATPGGARFVPPPVPDMDAALDSLERYLHQDVKTMPALIRLALIHYQFETIHPFLDGNGRVGRLLITIWLCAEKLLPQPLLYLSAFFEREKTMYSDLLLKVSQQGAWEEWIQFFLRGVAEQAADGVARSKRLLALRETYRQQLQHGRASGNVLSLLDELVHFPSTTISQAAKKLKVTAQGAQVVIERLEKEGILSALETKPRRYIAREILEIFNA
jgi:Fic family protein